MLGKFVKNANKPGNYICPKCGRKITLHIDTNTIVCQRCLRVMKLCSS